MLPLLEGKQAFLRGKALTDNPYHDGTIAGSEWTAGWAAADARNEKHPFEEGYSSSGDRIVNVPTGDPFIKLRYQK